MLDVLVLLLDAAEHVGMRVFAGVVELLVELPVQLLHVLLGLALVHLQLAPLQGQLLLQLVDEHLQIQVLLGHLLRLLPHPARTRPALLGFVPRVGPDLAGRRRAEFLRVLGVDLVVPPLGRFLAAVGALDPLFGETHFTFELNKF